MSAAIPEYIRSGGFVPTEDELRRLKTAPVNVTEPAIETTPSQPMLYAINDHLVPMTLTPEEQDMVSTTVLWVQHVAIGLCEQKGWTKAEIADPEKRNSKEYWDIAREALVPNTPWVSLPKALDATYYDKQHKGEVNISEVIETILKAVASEESAKQLATAANSIRTTHDVGVSNVVNFFWNSSSSYSTKSQCTMSPPSKVADDEIDYYYLFTFESLRQESWRTLFIQSSYEEFTFSTVCQTIGLSLTQWRPHEDEVKARLKDWISEQIKHAPLG